MTPNTFFQRRAVQWGIGIVVFGLLLVALGSRIMPVQHSIATVIAAPILLLLPGGFLTFLLFPVRRERREDDHGLDPIERGTLAILLSTLLISAVIWVLSRAGQGWLTPGRFIVSFVGMLVVLGIGAFWRSHGSVAQ